MSDYISKSALLDSLIYCDGLGRKSLEAVVKTINEQPTLDEKEIIRKSFERVVERLEEQVGKFVDLSFKETSSNETAVKEYLDEALDITKAIKIVKEECGINE